MSAAELPSRHCDHEDNAWQLQAACLGVDPELFFPARGESAGPAKAVCATCAVKNTCLDYALTNRETFGVWGGTSVRDRERILGVRLSGLR